MEKKPLRCLEVFVLSLMISNCVEISLPKVSMGSEARNDIELSFFFLENVLI